MNNIIKELLRMRYPELNVEAVMEVIGATPNATVATEILCGIYQEPVVPEHPGMHFTKRNPEYKNVTAKSYNKFEGRVVYSYERHPRKCYYFPQEARGHINQTNFKQFMLPKETDGSFYEYFYDEDVLETMTSNVTLADWIA